MNIKPSQVLVEEATKQIKTLSVEEVEKLLKEEEITLIDIRDIRELWKEGTIKNAIHIPRGMLEFWLDPQSSYYQEKKIGNIKNIVLFCALGFRSALATKTLKEMGGKEYSHIKSKLAEILVDEICPVGKEISKLMNDETFLLNTLRKGSEKANIKSEENLKKIREKVGLI